MSTEEPPPLDLTQFQALAGGQEAMRDLASFYIPFVAERLDALRSAVTADAADRVASIARQLAAANAAAGVPDIAAPLVTLERMAREGHLKTAAGVLIDAEAQFARITDFLLQYVEAVRPDARRTGPR
jgi:HPt (histidine-containing phosphotransfer) domain-containing protein